MEDLTILVRLVYTARMAATEELTIDEIGFTQAKATLSDLMTEVVHSHRPSVIARHGGKESAVLVGRGDLLATLSEHRFRPQIVIDGGEATAVLEDLGLVAAGGDFEEAMDHLVDQLREYAHDFLVERPSYYSQTPRARHWPLLLRFALTPRDEQLDLLYEDSRLASEELFSGDSPSDS
jgi:antitoxin YefM